MWYKSSFIKKLKTKNTLSIIITEISQLLSIHEDTRTWKHNKEGNVTVWHYDDVVRGVWVCGGWTVLSALLLLLLCSLLWCCCVCSCCAAVSGIVYVYILVNKTCIYLGS